MKREWSIIVGTLIIAASILFIGRYQISAIGFGYTGGDAGTDNDTQAVYRLDRWTGRVDYCLEIGLRSDGSINIICPATVPNPPGKQ